MRDHAAVVIEEVEHLCGWRVDLSLRFEVDLDQRLIGHARDGGLSNESRFAMDNAQAVIAFLARGPPPSGG